MQIRSLKRVDAVVVVDDVFCISVSNIIQSMFDFCFDFCSVRKVVR